MRTMRTAVSDYAAAVALLASDGDCAMWSACELPLMLLLALVVVVVAGALRLAGGVFLSVLMCAMNGSCGVCLRKNRWYP